MKPWERKYQPTEEQESGPWSTFGAATAEAAPTDKEKQFSDLTLKEALSLPHNVAKRLYDENIPGLKRKVADGSALTPSERVQAVLYSIPYHSLKNVTGVSADDLKNISGGIAMRAIPPVVAQRIGEFTRIPGAPQVAGGLGGVAGEMLAQASAGQVPTRGQMTQAFIQGVRRPASTAGMLPSQLASLAKEEAAVNMAASAAQQLIDEARIDPSLLGKEALYGGASAGVSGLTDTGRAARKTLIKQADNSVVNATIKASREANIPVLPGAARPNDFESAINALVRKDLGLPEDTPLSKQTMDRHFDSLYSIYDEAKQLSPFAASSVEGMKEARSEAKRFWKRYWTSQNTGAPNLELEREARDWDALADSFEADLIKEATLLGKQKVAQRLIETRPKLAKAYLADRSINYSRGVADSKVYGKLHETNPNMLTGDARAIADAHNAGLLEAQRTGTLLSRALTIGKMAHQAVSKTGPGQAYLAHPPSYYPYPDRIATLGRMATIQAGREDVQPNEDVLGYLRAFYSKDK